MSIDELYPEKIPKKRSGLVLLLKNRDFASIFVAGLISDVGSFFTFIAVLFLAIAKTAYLGIGASAQAVALITVINLIPSLILGPFAGVIVDHFDRGKMMVIADSIGAITSFGFIFATSIIHIYILSFFASTTRLFFYPAREASIPRIVEGDQLVSANGIAQTEVQFSGLIGPGLAGILTGLYGLNFAFLVDGTSFLISAFLIYFVRTNLKPETNGDKLSYKKAMVDLKEGLAIFKNDRILKFILITFSIVLIATSMVNSLFAFYLKNSFGLSETDFGLIISFSTISGFLGAIILTIKGEIKRKFTMILSSFFIAGLSVGLLGFAVILPNPIFWLYAPMALMGLVNILINIPINALLQAIVKNEHLGKINAVIGTVFAIVQVSGAGVAAYMAGFLPINLIFIGLGIFLVIFAIVFIVFTYMSGIEREAQEREEIAIKLMKEQKEKEEQLNVPNVIENTKSDNITVN